MGMSRAGSIPKRAGEGKGDEEEDDQYWLHHKKGLGKGRRIRMIRAGSLP